MSLTICERTFHNDNNHRFINAANALFSRGNSYYEVRGTFPKRCCGVEYGVIQKTGSFPGSTKMKWLALTILPIIILGIGLIIERCINAYKKLQQAVAYAKAPLPQQGSQSEFEKDVATMGEDWARLKHVTERTSRVVKEMEQNINRLQSAGLLPIVSNSLST